MRIKVLAFAVSLLLISNSSLGSPQSPSAGTNSSQGPTLLTQSLQTLNGSTAINDVALTGSVEWIAGSSNKMGAVTYKALLTANRLDMSFSDGNRSEIRSTGSTVPSGTWIELDGTSHRMSYHNLLTDPGWFPLFTLQSQASTNSIITVVGQETRNGESVIHLTISQQFPDPAEVDAVLMQHLTQVDIYLDSSTLLPMSYVFNMHADDNTLLDIPAEIRYSNYQRVVGGQIPLHVQKFVNNSLTLDLQFQNVQINTGLTAVQISTP